MVQILFNALCNMFHLEHLEIGKISCSLFNTGSSSLYQQYDKIITFFATFILNVSTVGSICRNKLIKSYTYPVPFGI